MELIIQYGDNLSTDAGLYGWILMLPAEERRIQEDVLQLVVSNEKRSPQRPRDRVSVHLMYEIRREHPVI